MMLRTIAQGRCGGAISRQWLKQPFHSLGLNPTLVDALKKSGIETPSQVQCLAIPMILDKARPDVIVGAETGSGKTLTYVLPLLERLASSPSSSTERPKLRKPVAVIMVPNQELVKQIESVVRMCDPSLHLACLTKTHPIPRHAAVVVGTPKAILQHASPKDLEFVETIVVDEADMLLGGGFERDTKQVLGVIRNQPLLAAHLNVFVDDYDAGAAESAVTKARHGRQTIFSAATIPTYGRLAVSEYLKHKFPHAEYAITDQFHRTVPTLDQSFLHLDDESTAARQALLLEILKKDTSTGGCTLVFTDSVASAKNVHAFLQDEGIACTMLHKEIPREERSAVLTSQSSDPSEKQIIVATDIAARGLDLRHVHHVIQYEFATNVVAHIHRIGRTARGGSTGKVTNIVTPANALVYKEIAAAGARGALTEGFSRRRSLRKKFKKVAREGQRDRDSDSSPRSTARLPRSFR
ncbi:Aste57867_24705 [Aphanomyces stellatus]|uniref:ATP-dependent RNA helicase n=1 Tax=Aphanomyces stellatus TaxID=120398 RepID=A0A485LR53_9STRA|nr:hypothetical protein As57867_024627 [Aphanomyces stellatus]VFU01342.1 Aste57867_24705 [Aphanomyces stellatus]